MIDRIVYLGGPGFTPVVGDWSDEGKDKLGAFSNGTWLLDANGNFTWDGPFASDVLVTFGTFGSVPVPGRWK